MKFLPLIAAALLSTPSIFAGESALTTTFQPLDGLGSGEITISAVVCHDWYSHSGLPTAIPLISAPNVPPTNNPKHATEDLNLASVHKIDFSTSDIDDPKIPLELTMDATKFVVPENLGYPREDIVRASLECLRRCLPAKLRKTPVTLKSTDNDKAWLSKIVADFNKHDRRKEFYSPPK